MIDHGDAPMVPIAATRRNEEAMKTECEPDNIREDITALRVEAPFVPLVSPKKTGKVSVAMPNTD